MDSAHRNRTLVIMAKAPRPGLVKTRLMHSLPAPAVMALYESLLEDTLTLAESLPAVQVAIMCPEADQQELAHFLSSTLGSRVPVVAQTGAGLAAGLTSVFSHFTSGGQHVIAFNSDSPHLPPAVLVSAFDILVGRDVVIGPTHDGGYYLVGAKASHPALFEGDGMGTKSALDRLITRTQALALSAGFTEPCYDVDIANDLLQLAGELRLSPEKAPRTAAWCLEWQQAVSQIAQ